MGQNTSKPVVSPEHARAANPFEVAPTMPAVSPSGGVPIAAPVEVVVDPMRWAASAEAEEEAAPSRQDLLLRAAELGPPRMTWENIVLSPTDPILGEKMQPHVAERRARFRRIVKVALGASVACCVVALIASAFSSSSESSSAATSTYLGKTAPSSRIVPIEKLDPSIRTKAPGHVTAAVRPLRTPKSGKRR